MPSDSFERTLVTFGKVFRLLHVPNKAAWGSALKEEKREEDERGKENLAAPACVHSGLALHVSEVVVTNV